MSSSALYVLCLTFWLKNGEVVHTRTQARLHNHNITKPVHTLSDCQRIAERTKLRYKDACKQGNTCERVEIICQRMTNSEFFSLSSPHRKHYSPPKPEKRKTRNKKKDKRKR